MKRQLLLLSVLMVTTGCHKELTLMHSDANWYPNTARNYNGPPTIEVRLANKHNKPLAGHRVHLDEVQLNPVKEDANSRILKWVSGQRDKEGRVELITDHRGRVSVSFETPSVFANDTVSKHWLRFSHTGKRKGHETDPKVACIVPVALCVGEPGKDIAPCFSNE